MSAKNCRHFYIYFHFMNRQNKILLLIALLLLACTQFALAKWVIDIGKSIWNWSVITNVSINPVWGWDALEKLQNGWLGVLHTLKILLSWVILIYLVFLGFQMIMAMWADDKLAAAKRQIYYTLVAFIFINIPWKLYDVFSGKNDENVTWKTEFSSVASGDDWIIAGTDANIFVNFFNWNSTVENWIISFVKAIVIWLVIMLFIMAWIWLISSGWNEEKRKKAKIRFLNWIMGLIFLGVIHFWTFVAYSWDIQQWQNLFSQLANLALFFTGPVAIFFLVLWGFYYITSAWDEAKAKKWIAIIKNTFIAVIILLASYAFLKDLKDLKF